MTFAFRTCLSPGSKCQIHSTSVIARIDYNASARELHVTFTSGRIYVYAGVPGEVYFQFCRAASKGEFFNSMIRDRHAFSESR